MGFGDLVTKLNGNEAENVRLLENGRYFGLSIFYGQN